MGFTPGAGRGDKLCPSPTVWSWSRDRGAELRGTTGGSTSGHRSTTKAHGRSCGLPPPRSEASIRAHLCSLAPASAFRPLKAGDAEHPQRISLGRHLSTRLIGSIKADPMTVLQPHETGSCALISVQDGQRRVRHLLAASRGMLQPRVDVLVVCGFHKTTLVGAGRWSVGGTPVQMLHG